MLEMNSLSQIILTDKLIHWQHWSEWLDHESDWFVFSKIVSESNLFYELFDPGHKSALNDSLMHQPNSVFEIIPLNFSMNQLFRFTKLLWMIHSQILLYHKLKKSGVTWRWANDDRSSKVCSAKVKIVLSHTWIKYSMSMRLQPVRPDWGRGGTMICSFHSACFPAFTPAPSTSAMGRRSNTGRFVLYDTLCIDINSYTECHYLTVLHCMYIYIISPTTILEKCIFMKLDVIRILPE